MAGAVAAVTSRTKVGTWVMSALHRNAGIIAKAAETLDEISGGRFVFGLGAGHEWPGQARAFGLPERDIFARFEEALQVIVPLLRGGHADFEGTWHAARDLPQRPAARARTTIPILIGGNGPKGQRRAARHADIYSCYVEERAVVDEVAPRLASLDAICAENGREPGVDRPVGRRLRPPARSGRPASGRDLRLGRGDRARPPCLSQRRLYPGRDDGRPGNDGGVRRPGARGRTRSGRLIRCLPLALNWRARKGPNTRHQPS